MAQQVCISTVCNAPNERFYDCVSGCPRPTCQHREVFMCGIEHPDFVCGGGCDCDVGFLRDELTGWCVSEDECPGTGPWDNCLENEYYNECGSSCVNTCDNPQATSGPCTDECVEGCFCSEGFVLDRDQGKCIPWQQCDWYEEPECPENMAYNACGTACPRTCDTRGTDMACTEQ